MSHCWKAVLTSSPFPRLGVVVLTLLTPGSIRVRMTAGGESQGPEGFLGAFLTAGG